ncbi:NUDIX hydrolase [Sphingobium sp.]|uniref:NUDIX hydrolase n=1 Tax=Sphingobium sp. TaxID=1912891 RepID=UPI002E21A077
MKQEAIRIIRIAAALIDDEAGRLLLVRKRRTLWFMQAGGKIEAGESAIAALQRELFEEVGLSIADNEARHLGRFPAPAANEADSKVEADVFHIRTSAKIEMQSEIEEAVWVSRSEALSMPLAPLTRDHVLPLSYGL